jgi:hypothetical protein
MQHKTASLSRHPRELDHLSGRVLKLPYLLLGLPEVQALVLVLILVEQALMRFVEALSFTNLGGRVLISLNSILIEWNDAVPVLIG